jgi:hypothetical protein
MGEKDNGNAKLRQGISLSVQEMEVLYGFLLPVKQDVNFKKAASFTFRSPSFAEEGNAKTQENSKGSLARSREQAQAGEDTCPLYDYYQQCGTTTRPIISSQDSPHIVRNLRMSFAAMNDLKKRVQAASSRVEVAYSSGEDFKRAIVQNLKDDALAQYPSLPACASSLLETLPLCGPGSEENFRNQFRSRQRIAKLTSFYVGCGRTANFDSVFSLDLVQQHENRPFVIHGKAFTGKSTLLANTVSNLYREVQREHGSQLMQHKHALHSFPFPASFVDRKLRGRVLSIFVERFSPTVRASSWTIDSIIRAIKFEAKLHYHFERAGREHHEWMADFGLWLEERELLFVIIIDGIDAVNGAATSSFGSIHLVLCVPFTRMLSFFAFSTDVPDNNPTECRLFDWVPGIKPGPTKPTSIQIVFSTRKASHVLYTKERHGWNILSLEEHMLSSGNQEKRKEFLGAHWDYITKDTMEETPSWESIMENGTGVLDDATGEFTTEVAHLHFLESSKSFAPGTIVEILRYCVLKGGRKFSCSLWHHWLLTCFWLIFILCCFFPVQNRICSICKYLGWFQMKEQVPVFP